MGLLYKICESNLNVVLPSSYSKELGVLVSKMVDRDPLARPSARELLQTPVVEAHAVASLEAQSREGAIFGQSLPPATPVSLPHQRPMPVSRPMTSPARDSHHTNPAPYESPRERVLRRKAEKAAERARELTNLAHQKAAENKVRFSADRERLHLGSRDSSMTRPVPTWPSSVEGGADRDAAPDLTKTWEADSTGVSDCPSSSIPIQPMSSRNSSREGSTGGPVWPLPSQDGPMAVWTGSTLGSTRSTMSSTLVGASHIALGMAGGDGATLTPIGCSKRVADSANSGMFACASQSNNAKGSTDARYAASREFSSLDADSPDMGPPTSCRQASPPVPAILHTMSLQRVAVHYTGQTHTNSPPIGVATSPSDDDDYSDDFETDDDGVSLDADEALRVNLQHLNANARNESPVDRTTETWEEAPVGTRATQLHRLQSLAQASLGNKKFDCVREWLRDARVSKVMNEADVQQHLRKIFATTDAEALGCFQVDQLVYMELLAM